MKKFKYYYDLEGVCGDCAVYRPKATSAETTATGYASNNESQSSDLNGDTTTARKPPMARCQGMYI